MVVFTGPDKALLDRAARAFDVAAVALRWEDIADPKKRKAAKLEFDRLKRDAFDLRALGVRLKRAAKVIASDLASQAAKTPPLVGQIGGYPVGVTIPPGEPAE